MAASLKILHADDEDGWRELVGFWLRNAGYDVRPISAGKGVIALARDCRPDCFLLDHDLGDTTGHELCKALRSTAEFQETPIIIMTAHADVLSAVVDDCPPDQFIVKSKQPEELLLILETLLAEKR